MVKNKMGLSIIIVNYNQNKYLEKCLDSIYKNIKGSFEVFVVDNNSKIKPELSKFPKVKLIFNKENLGFAKANNQAIKKARGVCILLLNPDTIIKEDLNEAVSFLEKNKNIGILSLKLVLANGKLDKACKRSFPRVRDILFKAIGLSFLFPNSKLFSSYNLTYLDANKLTEVECVNGAFMLVRREVFEKVSGFDEKFFLFGEDIDFCYRVKKAGFKIVYCPEAEILHFKRSSGKYYFARFKGLIKFWNKNGWRF